MSSALDAFTALEAWFGKFPEYLDNELWLSGESYAGIYVPYLAWTIYENNEMAKFQNFRTSYNLKGLLVGNGATNWDFDVSPSFPDTVYSFNIIPEHIYGDFVDNGCVFYFNDFRPHDGPDACEDLWDSINDLTSNLNWYDLY